MWSIALFFACNPDGEVGPPTPTPPPPTPLPIPAVFVNEVVAANDSTLGEGEFSPDWVELYNPGPDPVDLARVTLEDDGGERAPVGEGEWAPGTFLVRTADSAGGGDLPFGLSSAGDRVVLRVDGQIVDEVFTGELPDDVALARFPDGEAGEWRLTAATTPGVSNGAEPSVSLDPTDALLSPEQVWMMDLEITPQQYAELDGSVWGARPEVRAGFELDGFELPEIGMRLKGSASAQPMSAKPAFKLDFNEYVAGTRFRGLMGMNLHNGSVFDPTQARDHLTYTLARDAGLPAPRVGWTELWITERAYGLYVIQEDYDREWIEQHFPGEGDTSMVIEPNEVGFDFGSGWSSVGQLAQAVEVAPTVPDPRLQQTLVAIDELVRLAPTDANIEALWALVDRDNLTAYTAWEGMVGHFDGYMVNNNWRILVRGSDARLHLVPSGAEWTWEQSPQFPSGGALMTFCLANEGCKREVAIQMLEMADRIEELDLVGQFEDINAMLNAPMSSDPRRIHPQSTVQQTRSLTRQHLNSAPAQARNLVYAVFPDLEP